MMRRRGKQRRQFEDMPPPARAVMGVMTMVQFALLAVAMIDLIRRPSAQVRGRKLAWLPVLFINFIGPIAYLRFGRRPGLAPEDVGGEVV